MCKILLSAQMLCCKRARFWFNGPGMKVNKGNSMFMFGMLPLLRFKKDKLTPKSSFVTPNLGFGIAYIYNGLAIQIPLCYNEKTCTKNDKWNIGAGTGVRINKGANQIVAAYDIILKMAI